MRPVSGKTFAKLIERRGWRLVRIRGSHHVYEKDGEKTRLTVPVHGNTDLKLGLQRTLMKLAGLADNDL